MKDTNQGPQVAIKNSYERGWGTSRDQNEQRGYGVNRNPLF